MSTRYITRRNIEGTSGTGGDSFQGSHALDNHGDKISFKAQGKPTLLFDISGTHPELSSSSGKMCLLSSLIPTTNDTYHLGSDTNMWDYGGIRLLYNDGLIVPSSNYWRLNSHDSGTSNFMDFTLVAAGATLTTNAGNLTLNPAGDVRVQKPMRQSFDGANYATYTVDNQGDLTITPTGGVVNAGSILAVTMAVHAKTLLSTAGDLELKASQTGTGVNKIKIFDELNLNSKMIQIKGDEFHGFRDGSTSGGGFSGYAWDGPVMYGYDGGRLGSKDAGSETTCFQWGKTESKFKSPNAEMIVTLGAGVRTYLTGITHSELEVNYPILYSEHHRPKTNNSYDLGSAGAAAEWRNIYTVNSVTVSSDARIKDIDRAIDGEDALSFINELDPILYKRIDLQEEDPELRAGVTAQRVQSAKKSKFEDWTSILKLPEEDAEDDRLHLRYQEFIPFLIATTQELSRQVKDLREEVESWKTKAAMFRELSDNSVPSTNDDGSATTTQIPMEKRSRSPSSLSTPPIKKRKKNSPSSRSD